MIEKFNAPSYYSANAAILGLYATGRATGTVVDCGERMTYVVPVFESHALASCTQKAAFGGRDLTNYLQKISHDREVQLNRRQAIEFKKTCYVAFNYEEELHRGAYILPDGNAIQMQRFQTPEALFQPELMLDKPAVGIHKMTWEGIRHYNLQLRKDLFNNIVLSGGSTMFSGLADRLSKEMTAFANHLRVKVIASPERNVNNWIGGSILGSLSTFHSILLLLTAEKYHEEGPSVIHRLCF
eukprot:TRINITY_DN2472_c0_g1_i3.p1 TRINITY_DN2472_c0_g1~~TRINITY_DN2472_c0_g1_i3.p1  ORF type:complete len:241 (-),score=22.81 TRINITY_DN2472_c0_g1_i3:63-785(-)